MATQGQAATEQSAETVATTVSDVANEKDIPAFVLMSDTIGVRKWDFANESRLVREGNQAFKSWNLPRNKGNVSQSNKSVFTSRFVWSDMSVEEAVRYVIESGQFAEAVSELKENRPSWDSDFCQAVMTYNLYIVAKGWLAESQMADKSEMSKLWETNDLAGQDFQADDTFIQLKSWTFGLHNGNPNTDDNGNKVVYYAWIDGEINWSEDYTDLTDKMMDKAYVNFDDLRDYEWVEVMDF